MRIFLLTTLLLVCPGIVLANSEAEPFELRRGFALQSCDDHMEKSRHQGMSVATAKHLGTLVSFIEPLQSSRHDAMNLLVSLYSEFGSIGAILSATESDLRLRGVSFEVASVLLSLRDLFTFTFEERIADREVISSWDSLVAYLRARYRHNQTQEEFLVLYLDRKNKLIAAEQQGLGTVDHVPVYPREVAKRALALSASSVIIAHNHPSGDPSPSPEDKEMTQQLVRALETLGITVHDHIVVGRDTELSFRSSGYL